MCGKVLMVAGKSVSSARGFAWRISWPLRRFVSGIGSLMFAEENLLPPWQSFLKEAVIWKRLRHPNVVPFIGVTRDPLQFVSEYMPNGTLTRYIKNNPSADRIELVSPPLS